MLRTTSANEKHSTAHQSHTNTRCHGRWLINVVAVAVVAFHHIYFVCVFRLIIFLNFFSNISSYFCIFTVHFTLFPPLVCFARHGMKYFYSLVLDAYDYTTLVAGIPFFMLRMSGFFFEV